MGTRTQGNRSINVATPLGKDVLLLVGYQGTEGISTLFQYTLNVIAENSETVKFDQLLGQPVTVETTLPSGSKRFVNGICNRLSRAHRDFEFTTYHLEVVPKLWTLTRRVRSRIFQHISVPDILQKVLVGIDVTYEIQGTFHPRDYCVQYRESDFDFASRLMEEEGIFYYFVHSDSGHKMILANTPRSHVDVPGESTLIFDELAGGARPEERIIGWEKVQELGAVKYTLWDHCFELPHKHLEATQIAPETVQVGKVTHKLRVSGNAALEIYDYPGGYAQRFDGVNSGGGETPGEIDKIFEDNKRTAGIRMDQQASVAIEIKCESGCAQLTAGHKFKLTKHFEDNATYVVKRLNVECDLGQNYGGSGRSMEAEFRFSNHFTCIPFIVPYLPPRNTPKPCIHGTQTAVVVGPSGEEIFTDKYGRVKVQFHWDQEGRNDANSSCWVRCGMPWAGMNWGFFALPRIGHEVIVAFEEGDPDRPVITGSVYNADMMPPYKLPENKTQSTIKSRSSLGGGGFNEFRFEDKKGSEQVFLHAEKNLDIRVKNNRMENIGNDRHLIVKRDRVEETTRDFHRKTGRDWVEEVVRDRNVKTTGKEALEVAKSHSLKVGGDMAVKSGGSYALEATGNIYLKAQNVVLEGCAGVCLKVGGNYVTVVPAGVQINGTMVLLNSGGAALPGSPGSIVPPAGPAQPVEADDATPGGHKAYTGGGASAASGGSGAGGGPQAPRPARSEAPAHNPASEENKTKKSWIEIVLEDDEGQPIPGEYYEVKLPDGTTVDTGTLDAKGRRRIDGIDPGQCIITFPRIDRTALKRK